MGMKKWGKYSGIGSIEDIVNKLFDGSSLSRVLGDSSWSPPTDVYETDDSIRIIMELAGVVEDNISVSIEDNVLTVSGEKVIVDDGTKDVYYRLERSKGRFARSFLLRDIKLDEDSMSAVLKDGLLTISINKVDKIGATIIKVKREE